MQKTISFLSLLQDDHETAKSVLDELNTMLAEQGDWQAFSGKGQALLQDLRRHFVCEEQAFFPVLSQYRPMILMEVEHEELLAMQERFEASLSESGFTQEAQAAFHALQERLLAHILEEDRGIFPLADSRLSLEEKRQVERELDALNEELKSDPKWVLEKLERPLPQVSVTHVPLFESPAQPIALPTLYEREHHSLQHIHLQSGQKLAMHWAAQHQCLVVLTGCVRFDSEALTQDLQAGQIVTVDPRCLFSLEALEDASVLAFKIWPKPNYLKA